LKNSLKRKGIAQKVTKTKKKNGPAGFHGSPKGEKKETVTVGFKLGWRCARAGLGRGGGQGNAGG